MNSESISIIFASINLITYSFNIKIKILDDSKIGKNTSLQEYLLKIVSMNTALLFRQANQYTMDMLLSIIEIDELISNEKISARIIIEK